jgi:hypothetical protein
MRNVSSRVEIVRLPVGTGSQGALVAFLNGNPYFAQDGLGGSQILLSGDHAEVVLVLDWDDAEAPRRALASEAGEALVQGMEPLLNAPR